MRGALKLVNQSVDSSGLTKDYKEALCEYIWNGFEAGATSITLSNELNELNGLKSITIEDNGEGIEYTQIENTFGTFLSSQKNQQLVKVKSSANKGKGRFSFICFASNAEWKTTYKDGDNYYSYIIGINENSKDEYTYSSKESTQLESGGTIVKFNNIKGLLPEELDFKLLEDTFLKEFSWFLYLNRNKGFNIIINGEKLDFNKYINVELSEELSENILNFDFNINIIVWQEKIREKFCCYFYDSEDVIKGKETTSFNRNTIEFNHSVFVKSAFFNHRNDVSLSNNSNQITADEEEMDRFILKELKVSLQSSISEVMKEYMVKKADKAVNAMEKRETFPKFSDDPYEQLRKKDLVKVTKEIYCLEPRIFHKLKDVQEKSFLGFLNLLLKSEERENVLTIIDQIVKLTTEQRKDFAEILKKTNLENVIKTMKFIEDRYKVMEVLKLLVYDLTKFTNERDHIQQIIEQHYWLFGDQYSLVSADVGMKQALLRYQNLLYGEGNVDAQLNADKEEQRRMDIFLCGARNVSESFNVSKEENIIVELKAPSVKLTKKVYRQVEDYMDYIIKQPKFNSQRRIWKFIAVCNEVDEDIKSRYSAFEQSGKPGLVHQMENYEIYAYTWDDVFKEFELKHSFVLDKLKYKKELLTEEIESTVLSESRETSNKLTKLVLA